MRKISTSFLFFAFFSIIFLVALGGCIQPPKFCGDTFCQPEIGETRENCPADCPLIDTHLECKDQQCVQVEGAGADQCATNADCVPQTHSECVNQQCVIVEGAGVNQCTIDADCLPPECGNGKCDIGENEQSCSIDCSNLNVEIGVQTEKDVFLKGEDIILTDPPSPEIASNVGLSLQVQEVENKGIVTGNFYNWPVSRNLSEWGLVDYNVSPQKEPKVQGYIVKLKLPPLIEKLNELESKLKKGLIRAGVAAAQYNYYKTQLAITQQAAIKSFTNILGQIKVRQKFTKVLNAISLDISEEQANKLLQSPYVEKIYPNYEVKILLNESVPQINADKVWQLKDAYDNNITGKGITIAIIDTGIDYRHPSLGSCFVEEPTETCFPEKSIRDGDCQDTDGGKNACHVGYTKWRGGTSPDRCSSKTKNYISEQYCKDGKWAEEEIFCKHSCTDSSFGGRCNTANNINDGTCKKVIGGYDFVNNDNDPLDDQGHGTHVAAIAAGNGALKGVAPDAKLLAYKVLDEWGSSYYDWVIAGIERAVDPNQDGDTADHVDVISMSIGALGSANDILSHAVDKAVEAGVVAVIAAGNSGPDGDMACSRGGDGSSYSICSPGTARKVITVGATCKKSQLNDLCMADIAPFSSRGPNTPPAGVKPDVVAPGVNICAAQYDAAFELYGIQHCFGEDHVAIGGTSMATPHVAGAVALLLQAHPDWQSAEIKAVLIGTAKQTTSNKVWGNLEVYNYPGLDPSFGKEFCLKFDLKMKSRIRSEVWMSSFGSIFEDSFMRAIIRRGEENPGEIIQVGELQLYVRLYDYAFFGGDLNTLSPGSYWFCTEPTIYSAYASSLKFFSADKEDRFLEKYMDANGQWFELQAKDLSLHVISKRVSSKFDEGGGEIDVLGAVDAPFIITHIPLDLTANYKANDYAIDLTLTVKNIKSSAQNLSVSAELDSIYNEAIVSISPQTVSFGENRFTLRIYNSNRKQFNDKSVYSGVITFYSPSDKKAMRVPFSLYIEYSPPKLEYIRPLIKINGDINGIGLRASTDDYSYIKMYYRLRGNVEFKEIDFRWQYGLFEKKLNFEPGVYEFYLVATNTVGLTTIADNGGEFFKLTVPATVGKQITSPNYYIAYKLPNCISFITKDTEGNYLDFDRDGKKEIICNVNDDKGQFILYVFEDYGTGQFVDDFNIPFPSCCRSLYVTDLDKDGLNEIIYLGSNYYTLKILEATPDNPYPNKQVFEDSDSNYLIGNTGRVQIADLDNDGKKEVIVVGANRNELYRLVRIRFYESIGDNKLGLVTELPYKAPGVFLSAPDRLYFMVTDIDNDSEKEMITVGEGVRIKIFEKKGDNLFEEVYDANVHDEPEFGCSLDGVGIADLDKDGKKEVITELGCLTSLARTGYLLYTISEYDGNSFKPVGSIKRLTSFKGGRMRGTDLIITPNLYGDSKEELVLARQNGTNTLILNTGNPFNGIEGAYYIENTGGNPSNLSDAYTADTFDYTNDGYDELILNSAQNTSYPFVGIYSFPTTTKKQKSQILNNSSKAVEGKLSMKVQSWNGSALVDEKVVVDRETISIAANSVFALDKRWVAKGAYLANKSGRFKVFVSFEFASQKIEDFYEFEVA